MNNLTPAQYAFRKRVREVADDIRAKHGMRPAEWRPLREKEK